MSVVPTPAQIRAQVSAVLEKIPDARVIGIRSPLTAELGDTLRLGDVELAVARSDSVLEIRERLEGLTEGSAPMVLLTPVAESELGADVLGRLARRQLFSIDPWQLVKDRFRARFVDPRLVQQHPWIARALLEAEPDGGYPPAPSGFVQADLVWGVLFKALLGLSNGDRDAEAWIEWSLDPDKRELAIGLAPEMLTSLSEAVGRVAGIPARAVFDCAVGENGDSTLAIGLAARVLFGDRVHGAPTALKATGKLEALLGGEVLETKTALAWADAAESVIGRLLARRPTKEVQPLLKAADDLLVGLGAGDLAYRSGFLLTGFKQRLERFGDALAAVLGGKKKGALAHLTVALDLVLDHALAPHEAARVEGAEMAARLARWITGQSDHPPKPAASLAQAASLYRQDGGYVDWARFRVWEGDTLASLGKAYAALWQAVADVREKENRRFGELLANWSKTGSHDHSVIPVEHLVERVIAHLAARHPVLLVLIDGMGMAVFRELQVDLIRRGWVEMDTPAGSCRLPVIAALPTVTEVSRTSLLCGKLSAGNASGEKAGFSQHSALVSAGSRSKPPVLFHKAELAGDGSAAVASKVVGAIADDKQRVVGVVINAVDDHLAKGDQIRVDWTVRRIKPLEELLSAASDAGRAVVVVSDHGHIPEQNTVGRGEESAERWREAVGKPQEDEVLVAGPRVALGEGHKIIAPWSERVRYSAKKNGYHGGVSPQEVVIPLGIFAPAGVAIEGWSEVSTDVPAWWEPEVEQPVQVVKTAKAAKPKPPSRLGEQGRLFPSEEEVSAAATASELEWIDRLMASEMMALQRQMASRVALPEERIRAILVALEERGGKLTRPALAKRIGVPPMRLGGMISALRRLLNVEGYAVLSVDEQSDTVELNRKQLFTQFNLGP
jgi:hypothetical protein